jgi:nicotinamide-nucleotide adenylyltransferase
MNGILIGRFQPFHLGHLEAVIFGLTKVDTLFIGIGSSNKSHQDRNPFTADERKEMILSSLEEKIQERVSIYYIPDSNDHSKWTDSIDKIIPSYDIVFSNDDFTHELFEKHKKKVISVELKSRQSLSGTNIRNMILNEENWQKLVPDGTRNILLKIGAKNRLKDL